VDKLSEAASSEISIKDVNVVHLKYKTGFCGKKLAGNKIIFATIGIIILTLLVSIVIYEPACCQG
jgi:hypothetical protein